MNSNTISHKIAQIKSQGLFRQLSNSSGIDFISNDYLGLSAHPGIIRRVRKAMKRGVPIGATGSRLLGGNHIEHQRLEEAAEDFFSVPRALFVSSGYLANLGLFSSLPSRRGAIVIDERVHASIKEGVRASLAKKYIAKHNDLQGFENAIKRARVEGAQDVWVAIESLYSMDGDFAPVDQLLEICKNNDARLVVDEAHAVGVWGDFGRGLLNSAAVQAGVAMAIYPCGKAIGSQGAIITGAKEDIDCLINSARPFIYSTAPSPIIAVGIRKSLKVIDSEPWRREALKLKSREAAELIRNSRHGYRLGYSGSQILSLIVGSNQAASECARKLSDRGFRIKEVRPPTVPNGTARLRISITVKLSSSSIKNFANALQEISVVNEH